MSKDQIKEYLSQIGKRGGESKSPAKTAAVRRNVEKARLARSRKAAEKKLFQGKDST